MQRHKLARIKLIIGGIVLTSITVLIGYFVPGHTLWRPGQSSQSGLVRQTPPAPAFTSTPAPTRFDWLAQIAPLAGDGVAGWRDGTASTARFADPFGLVQDRSGNLFVADGGDNNRIRKITPAGVVTTLAGEREGFADGQAGNAAFHTPSGLAMDAAGNLIVADTGNNAIRKITPEGMVSTLAGNGHAGFRDGPAKAAQFNGPLGVATDTKGNIYVADTYNDRIRMITRDGQVHTLGGGDHPGFQDGPAHTALFDTPCAVALNAQGELFIADTRNHALRKLDRAGEVSTVLRSLPEEHDALFRRPQGLAITADGYLYVSEAVHGRIFQVAPGGQWRGLTGVDIDIVAGDDTTPRFASPVALALDNAGALYVADASRYVVGKLVVRKPATKAADTALGTVQNPAQNTAQNTAQNAAPISATISAPISAPPASSTTSPAGFPWPLKPQDHPHEIVGTMGEVRGNYQGESRDHFHRGLDVQAAPGTPVLAIANEKVSRALPNWGHGELHEGIATGTLSYIHLRIGRTARDAPLDPARFQLINDEKGKPVRVRIKRGTRFRVGDVLGTVNRMAHVHLNFNPAGSEVNPLSLAFNGFADHIAPHIEAIELYDRQGHKLAPRRGGHIVLPATPATNAAGRDGHDGHDGYSIVVEAYDQMDGNQARRRLGLYRLGYQILHADGSPVPGFEQPQMNLEFNRLPPDEEAVKTAYADNSGITVFGSATTRFRYVATNTLRDGHAKTGFWHPAGLPHGDYLIRIFAADHAGNWAGQGRDLAISIN